MRAKRRNTAAFTFLALFLVMSSFVLQKTFRDNPEDDERNPPPTNNEPQA